MNSDFKVKSRFVAAAFVIGGISSQSYANQVLQGEVKTCEGIFSRGIYSESESPALGEKFRTHLKNLDYWTKGIAPVTQLGIETAQMIAQAPNGETFARLLYISLTEKSMYYETQQSFYDGLLKTALKASRNYELSPADQALIIKGLNDSMAQDSRRSLSPYTNILWGGSKNQAQEDGLRSYLFSIDRWTKDIGTVTQLGVDTANFIAQAPNGEAFARLLYISLTEKSMNYEGQQYFYDGLLKTALVASRKFELAEADNALIMKGLEDSMKQDSRRSLSGYSHLLWGRSESQGLEENLRSYLNGIDRWTLGIEPVRKLGVDTGRLISEAPNGEIFARLLHIALTEKSMHYERQNYFYEGLLDTALAGSRKYKLSEGERQIINNAILESTQQDSRRQLKGYTQVLWGGV